MIDREQFIQEQKLRQHVRKAINHVRNLRLQEQTEEDKLRGVIRRLISEAAVSEDPPHSNTGINALKHLLKNTNILKVLKDGYKALTTDADQRQSFRAHGINGVQGILAPARSLDKVDAAAEPAVLAAELFKCTSAPVFKILPLALLFIVPLAACAYILELALRFTLPSVVSTL